MSRISPEKRRFGRLVLKRMALHLSDRPFLGQKIGEYTPFQVLISTIISQRTRDENTDKASALLFAKYETAEKLAKAPEKEIARLIHACGFYNQKARRIKQVSELLVRDFGGVVPNSKEALLSLPGVGPKTANCVLVYGFSTAAIPVDTHVHRISNRLGLVKTKAPEQTEKELEKIYDRKDWMLVNDLFVRFGQTTCRPIGPKCATCPLNDVCPTGKRILLKSRKK